MSKRISLLQRLKLFWKTLGPGLITGASDDDPSAITTFSQAGARYGLATLWMAIFAYPIMAVLQGMCARIGIVTHKGLTSIIKTHYPLWVLYLLLVLSCPAFLLNIGADIAALGEAGNLLFPTIPSLYCSIGFTMLLFTLILILPFKKLASLLKLLCLSLLIYIIVPFFTSQKIGIILKHSIVPTFYFNKEFLLIVTGIIGAIISPYLFFWQISSEVEEMRVIDITRKRKIKYSFFLMRKDILAGSFFAVLIMYFIILSTGTILYNHQIYNINSIKEASLALKPISGNLSYILFSIGIIGTGFLIIPILSISISYILTEAFNLKSGLNKSPKEAWLFYLIIAVSMCIGVIMNWLQISPVKALLFTTITYGIASPFLIAIILHISNNKRIMGEFCNNKISNIIGIIALLIMFAILIILGFTLLI